MPYRRKKNGRRIRTWYMDLKLPGYGRFGPFSTKTSRRETAEGIEAMIVSLNDRGRRDLLDLLTGGRMALMDAYMKQLEEGERGLEKLATEVGRAADDPPLIQAVETFLAAANDPRYRSTFNWLLRKAPKDARLSWLADPHTIQALLDERLASGIRPGTVGRDKAAISAFLGHHLGEAKRREILYRRVRVKNRDNGRVRWLSREEIDRLREASGDWSILWCLLLATGIRRGEAITLRVEDLDFETGQVRVWGTKSEAAKRVVPLEGETVCLLRGWIAANDLGLHDHLFPGLERNKGFNVWRAWRQCCDVAGVREVTVHDLRHTFAVHAVKAGMPLPELQRRLGHTKVKETWRYASFVPPTTSEQFRATLDRMGLGPARHPSVTQARRLAVQGLQSHQPCHHHARPTRASRKIQSQPPPASTR